MPPILSLHYEIDENGVIRPRNTEFNNSLTDFETDIYYSDDNITVFWGGGNGKNKSSDLAGIFDYEDISNLISGNW